MNKSSTIKKLCISALMIALATVLSLIPLFKMPLGGTLTPLSMFPICIVGIKYGTKQGIFTAFAYSLIQIIISIGEIMSWGLSKEILIGSIFLDYIIAYTILGLSAMFRKGGTKGICAGMALAMFMRFFCHFLSGIIFFDTWCTEGWNLWVYSLCYNGAYIMPELILSVILMALLLRNKQVKKLLTEE